MLNFLAQSDTINLKPDAASGFVSLGGFTIPSIVSGLIRLSLVVAAIVFFFILVIGGIKWIASGGDKAQTEGARSQITAALVGLVIIILAFVVIMFIQNVFKVNVIGNTGLVDFSLTP